MRVWLILLLLGAATTAAQAETFALPAGRKLEIYPVGEWRMRGEDLGEYRIVIVPKDPQVNATCTIAISSDGSDDFPTPQKLEQQVGVAIMRILTTGNFVERKPLVKPLYPTQGFGSYTVLTDAKLVGRPRVLEDYKQVCLGLIRLRSGVMARMQILSDGEDTPEFQQLLGMVEGMTLTP